MATTIKLAEETKKRLESLDIAEKGKTFDMLVNDLITHYRENKKKYQKGYKEWEKGMKNYDLQMKKYKQDSKEFEKEQKIWKKLLKWAKSKGFKE